jgi:hypothetical protein
MAPPWEVPLKSTAAKKSQRSHGLRRSTGGLVEFGEFDVETLTEIAEQTVTIQQPLDKRSNDVSVRVRGRQIEKISEDLVNEGRLRGVSLYVGPLIWWYHFKREFKKFVCDKDPKYRSLKRNLVRHGGRSETFVVSTIAAGLAVNLGPISGVLVPLTAVSLIAVSKLGVEAFCVSEKLAVEIPTAPSTKNRKRKEQRASKASALKAGPR